jgi:hypothetical protein
MPAAAPACGGDMWRARLMEGNANEIFVRSINAMVYMMKATGMMCSQRCEGMIIGPETSPQHISSHARLATASAMFQTSPDFCVWETDTASVARVVIDKPLRLC